MTLKLKTASNLVRSGKLLWSKPHCRFPLIAVLLFTFAVLFAPVPRPLFPEDYSTLVLDREDRILRAFLNRSEQWHFPPSHVEYSPKLAEALLAYEDRRFYRHPGVDGLALLRALWQNLQSGEVVSGASTITMQVSRLSGGRERTLVSKVIEILQSLKLELLYSKDEILRLYLDHAPFGGNIVGIQAAALRYYGKTPRQLTWGEAAALAVLPNAPGLVSPHRNSDLLRAKRDRVLLHLARSGRMDLATCRTACEEPLPAGIRPIEVKAPHLAQRLKEELGEGGGVVRTTIDGRLQEQLEHLARNHGDLLLEQSIGNLAVIIAGTESGHVVAYVGSKSFHDPEEQGQVDGVSARRSSGSLLKPFLFALAIDEGLLLPESLMMDVPTWYGAFSPANADERFNGIVSARDALARSLNVPAVRLLYSYGLDRFYHFLKDAGLTTLFRTAEGYGLPLVLGGGEVSLYEIAGLYRGLANGGSFEAFTLLRDSAETMQRGRKLISTKASRMTLEMLSHVRRPGVEAYWQNYEGASPLAWKTGTSYGQRDGWAIGVTPRWTVGVWVGNFDGEGNAIISGARCAGPLLFDILNMISAGELDRTVFSNVDEGAPLELCLTTGYRSIDACPQTVMATVPAETRSWKQCPFHESVFLNEDGSYRVCSLCWSPGAYRQESRLVFPAEVAQFLRQGGQLAGEVPPHNPECASAAENTLVEILYPRDHSRLFIPREFGGQLQSVVLRAAHREQDRRVFWYVDDQYLGETRERHEKVLQMSAGWHTLEVVDESGARDRIRFHVSRAGRGEL